MSLRGVSRLAKTALPNILYYNTAFLFQGFFNKMLLYMFKILVKQSVLEAIHGPLK